MVVYFGSDRNSWVHILRDRLLFALAGAWRFVGAPSDLVINFTNVARRGWGRAARIPLRAIPPWLCVPILQGPAQGLRWRVGAGDHGCWLGSYELEAQLACFSILKAGDAAYDVGANAGFFSLLMSRLVGPLGRISAFEPVASNVTELRQTLSRNGVTNVDIVNVAVANHTGTSRFSRGDSRFVGRLHDHGEDVVATMALDDAHGGGARAPRLIKIDVEGAGADVIRGARQLLTGHRPTLLFELHGEDELRAVERELDAVNYDIVDLQGVPFSSPIDWSHFLRALGLPRRRGSARGDSELR
jgi:FkbM family methyltransferase